jgi:hypothetical protein
MTNSPEQINAAYLILSIIILMNTVIIYTVSAEPYVDLYLIPSNSPEPHSDISEYSYGEPVILNISLVNSGSGSITVMGTPPLMGIRHTEGSDFRKYSRSKTAIKLPAGQSYDTKLTWDQKDENGEQVVPGIYIIGVYYLYSTEDNGENFDLSNVKQCTRTAKILIQPPQGTMQKKLYPHNTKQDNGVRATLVSLECNRTKGVFTFDVEIPEKEIDLTPRPTGLVPCEFSIYPTAQYRIDNGKIKDFQDFYWTCDTGPSQVHVVTMISEPLPADAKNMEIKVTKFGNHEGRWNYYINFSSPEINNGSYQWTQDLSKANIVSLPLAIVLAGIILSIIIAHNINRR